ncbi:MAG: ABC transporter permease subunit, partial [Pseudomonadota bacterium]
GFVRPLFLPSPEMVFQKFIKISCLPHYWARLVGAAEIPRCDGFSENSLHMHILWSVYRVFLAFGLAIITAIPIGLAMGANRIARGVFDPPIEFYRPIPPLAYLPLTIIWFGIGDIGKIFLIYLACFAPLAISARAGVRSCSIEQIHAAYSMGATSGQLLWHVVFKAALPEILTGMRIAIAFGWTTLVAAEMVAAKAGIGVMVLNAARFLATDIVFLGIIVIGLIALTFDFIMRRLDRVLVPWKGYA